MTLVEQQDELLDAALDFCSSMSTSSFSSLECKMFRRLERISDKMNKNKKQTKITLDGIVGTKRLLARCEQLEWELKIAQREVASLRHLFTKTIDNMVSSMGQTEMFDLDTLDRAKRMKEELT